MATRSTVCPACAASVPRGRLSCPSCGILLASVAGSGSRRASKSTSSASPTTADASPPVSAGPPPVGAYIPPSATPPPSLLPARSWAGLTSVAPRTMAIATAGAMAGPGPSPAMAGAVVSVAQAPQGQTHASPALPTDEAEAVPGVEATWLEATAGWLMIIGSAVAILGFLLPWSQTVIGAEGVGSYFDTWGMANASHLLVVLALLAALGLAIVANPLPTWVRTCAVGLLLGGVLVGLTWPYLFGPLGAGPGVMAILVGGLMLVIAGLLDLVEARHAVTDTGV